MKTTEIVISRKFAYRMATGLAILVALLLLSGKFSAFDFGRSQNTAGVASVESTNLAAGSQEKFTFLSGHGGQRSVGST